MQFIFDPINVLPVAVKTRMTLGTRGEFKSRFGRTASQERLDRETGQHGNGNYRQTTVYHPHSDVRLL